MEVLDDFRGVLLVVLSLISLGTIIGTFLVYKYKIRTNCTALRDVSKSVKGIELMVPKFVTIPDLEDHCTKYQGRCVRLQEKRDVEMKEQLEKVEMAILRRLEMMDHERNSARKEDSDERVIRVEAWTKLSTHVEDLTKRVEKLETRG